MTAYTRQNGLLRDRGFVLVADAKDIRGVNGAELYTRAPQSFDHFLQAAVPSSDFTESKTNTGAIALLSNAIGGVIQIPTSGASGDALAEVWKRKLNPSKNAKARPVSFEARVLIPTLTTVEVSFGLTDQTAVSGGIAYTASAASAVTTSTPSDGAAFYFGSVPTSGALFLSGGNSAGVITSIAGTDTAAAIDTPVAMDSNYHIYRIEVDVNGAAMFFIDDKKVKFVNGAVTANSVLSPFFSVVTRTAAAREIDVDYLQFAGDLATTTT